MRHPKSSIIFLEDGCLVKVSDICHLVTHSCTNWHFQVFTELRLLDVFILKMYWIWCWSDVLILILILFVFLQQNSSSSFCFRDIALFAFLMCFVKKKKIWQIKKKSHNFATSGSLVALFVSEIFWILLKKKIIFPPENFVKIQSFCRQRNSGSSFCFLDIARKFLGNPVILPPGNSGSSFRFRDIAFRIFLDTRRAAVAAGGLAYSWS